jgi:chloramphenicol-sensitive protein RarD
MAIRYTWNILIAFRGEGKEVMDQSSSNWDKVGLGYAFLAYTAWGFLPLYWKMLKSVPAYEVLLHRMVWSFIFVTVILLVMGKWDKFKVILKSPKTWASVSICAVLISINWFLYIWAVNTNQIIEASLGYYINPLISVLLGLLVLKEKLSGLQYTAVTLAAIGVAIPISQLGSVPWIALSLAISFALYGLAKKMANLESIVGLALETMIITPFALIYLAYLEASGVGSIPSLSITELLFLIGSGIATATPLLWFAQAANRIPLSAIGFMQYLAPSISLVLGIYIYDEPFTKVHLLSFMFIWGASILYAISKSKWSQRKKISPIVDNLSVEK